jgi:hypothetical protein
VIGALLYPCADDGTHLHNEPSSIAEVRRLENGTYQYLLEGFTQWRDEKELRAARARMKLMPRREWC